MILRVVFFALMALGLTGFGAVAWLSTRPPAPQAAMVTAAAQAATQPTKRSILVTARTVHAGSLLKPEDLIGKELPISGLDANAIADSLDARNLILGSMVRRGLAAGEPVRSEAIVKPGEHGFLAAVLGAGMRGITIGVDFASGSSGLIWPGDRVDLILTQTIGEAAVPLGRRIAAETVMHNIRVIAIDQQLIQGAAPVDSDSRSRTVTLEVAAEQAERLSVAMRLGRLSLSLRSAADPRDVADLKTGPIWARDVSPALSRDAAPVIDSVVRIFQGAAEAKEFKF